MDQPAMMRMLIEQASAKLRRAVSGVPSDLFGQRPGPGLNPVGFIYFHILRSWDEDLSVLCQDLPPDGDVWHRAGLSAKLDYEPLGHGRGGRGVGVGFDDTEVDAVPQRLDILTRYHDLLDNETGAWLESRSADELNRKRHSEGAESRGISRYSPASLLVMIALHQAEHAGDIKFVKGMLGMPDATFPGSTGSARQRWRRIEGT